MYGPVFPLPALPLVAPVPAHYAVLSFLLGHPLKPVSKARLCKGAGCDVTGEPCSNPTSYFSILDTPVLQIFSASSAPETSPLATCPWLSTPTMVLGASLLSTLPLRSNFLLVSQSLVNFLSTHIWFCLCLLSNLDLRASPPTPTEVYQYVFLNRVHGLEVLCQMSPSPRKHMQRCPGSRCLSRLLRLALSTLESPAERTQGRELDHTFWLTYT